MLPPHHQRPESTAGYASYQPQPPSYAAPPPPPQMSRLNAPSLASPYAPTPPPPRSMHQRPQSAMPTYGAFTPTPPASLRPTLFNPVTNQQPTAQHNNNSSASTPMRPASATFPHPPPSMASFAMVRPPAPPTYSLRQSRFKQHSWDSHGLFHPQKDGARRVDFLALTVDMALSQGRDGWVPALEPRTRKRSPHKQRPSSAVRNRPATAADAPLPLPLTASILAAREAVLLFFSQPNCFLFSDASDVVAVSDEDIDLLTRKNGGLQATLEMLDSFEREAMRFASFEQLLEESRTRHGWSIDALPPPVSRRSGPAMSGANYERSPYADHYPRDLMQGKSARPSSSLRREIMLDEDGVPMVRSSLNVSARMIELEKRKRAEEQAEYRARRAAAEEKARAQRQSIIETRRAAKAAEAAAEAAAAAEVAKQALDKARKTAAKMREESEKAEEQRLEARLKKLAEQDAEKKAEKEAASRKEDAFRRHHAAAKKKLAEATKQAKPAGHATSSKKAPPASPKKPTAEEAKTKSVATPAKQLTVLSPKRTASATSPVKSKEKEESKEEAPPVTPIKVAKAKPTPVSPPAENSPPLTPKPTPAKAQVVDETPEEEPEVTSTTTPKAAPPVVETPPVIATPAVVKTTSQPSEPAPSTPAPAPKSPAPNVPAAKSASKPKATVCESCFDVPAIVDCPECQSKLCADCDTEMHQRGKQAAHTRVPLDGAKPSETPAAAAEPPQAVSEAPKPAAPVVEPKEKIESTEAHVSPPKKSDDPPAQTEIVETPSRPATPAFAVQQDESPIAPAPASPLPVAPVPVADVSATVTVTLASSAPSVSILSPSPPVQEPINGPILCDHCSSLVATRFCATCNLRLCQADCDNEVHAFKKSSHAREPWPRVDTQDADSATKTVPQAGTSDEPAHPVPSPVQHAAPTATVVAEPVASKASEKNNEANSKPSPIVEPLVATVNAPAAPSDVQALPDTTAVPAPDATEQQSEPVVTEAPTTANSEPSPIVNDSDDLETTVEAVEARAAVAEEQKPIADIPQPATPEEPVSLPPAAVAVVDSSASAPPVSTPPPATVTAASAPAPVARRVSNSMSLQMNDLDDVMEELDTEPTSSPAAKTASPAAPVPVAAPTPAAVTPATAAASVPAPAPVASKVALPRTNSMSLGIGDDLDDLGDLDDF